jgi:hypothetical protein
MSKSRLTAVPAKRSSAPILQIRIILVLGSLLLAAAAGIFSAFAWLSLTIPEPDLSKALPEGKAIAEIAAKDWLSGTPLSVPSSNVELPGSENPLPYSTLNWDGFTPGTLPSGNLYELHSFSLQLLVTDEEGKTSKKNMILTVPISLNSDGDSIVVGLPYLEQSNVTSENIVFDYSDVNSEQLPPGATQQITKWAQNWATDNREQLKLLTGDTTQGVEYKGIGGFDAERVQIVNSLPGGDTAYGSDTFLVRIRIFLSSKSANKFSTATELDLTLADTNSGLPKIVGWGPAGKGLQGPQDTRVILK